MSFIRHVGKHGDRKVAVVFREVPGEPHMCLVAYTELLNKHVHDAFIKCIESDIGQNSENLADALNRSYATDGRPILQILHIEGQLKKVQTAQIIMTPAPNTKIRLDELNKMLDEMKLGEEAVKKLSEMDKSLGMQDPASIARKMRQPTNTVQSSGDALGDSALAAQRMEQAQKMERDANGLLAESKRLMDEARSLDPKLAKLKAKAKTPKKVAPVVEPTPAPKVRKARAKVSA